MRAVEMSLPKSSNNRHAHRVFDAAVSLLQTGRQREVICSNETLAEAFTERGFLPPSRIPLERAMLARTALSVAVSIHAESVAIYAPRPSRELDDAVALLSRRLRNISILLERGGEGYALRMRRELGLSVRTDSEALVSAEVKLLYAIPGFPLGKGVAVGVIEHASAGLRTVRSLRYVFPERLAGCGYPPEQAASVMLSRGILRPEEIGIIQPDISNSIDNSHFSHYNAIWNSEIRRDNGALI